MNPDNQNPQPLPQFQPPQPPAGTPQPQNGQADYLAQARINGMDPEVNRVGSLQNQGMPQVPTPQPTPNPAADFSPRYTIPQGQALPPKSSVSYPWTPVTGPDTSQYSLADQQAQLSEAAKAPSRPLSPSDAAAPGQFPQYGDPMAVLPPLGGAQQAPAAPQMPQQPLPTMPQAPAKPKRHLHKWVVLGLLAVALLACLGLAILFATRSHKSDNTTSKKPNAQQTTSKAVTYNNAAIADMVRNNKLNTAAVAKLDKNNTFFSAFRAASQQPIVRTKWDVYYTKKQNDKRGTEYTFYDVSTNYTNKAYTYIEDDYRKIGTWQVRCIGAEQYIFDATKSSTATQQWHRASDDSSCALASVATHMSDGMNTGGLNPAQSDAFIQYVNKTGAVKVNSLQLVTPSKNVSYLKFDIDVTPQRNKDGNYVGMQLFEDALRAAGIASGTQPYSYFGASGDGVHLTYYVDPLTMLPVYAAMVSTPSYSKQGKPVTPGSWSHRLIEYNFPLQLPTANLDDHAPISFSAWPDH